MSAFEPRNYEELKDLAGHLAAAGLFKSPSAAIAVMMAGADLGIPPSAAARKLHLIGEGDKTKVELSGDLAAGMILRSEQCVSWRIVETTAEKCTITTQRRGYDPFTYSYTAEMARKAQLAGRPNYLKHPDAMLRARCIGAVGRMIYPDVLAGFYTEGEVEPAEQFSTLPAPPVVQNVKPKALDAGAHQVLDLPPSDDVPQLASGTAGAIGAPDAITGAIARCASGQALLSLAPEVLAAGPAAVVTYAGAWEKVFRRYDDATARDVVGYIQRALPPQAFAHECWTWLEDRRAALAEADEERAAIQGEAGADQVPS